MHMMVFSIGGVCCSRLDALLARRGTTRQPMTSGVT